LQSTLHALTSAVAAGIAVLILATACSVHRESGASPPGPAIAPEKAEHPSDGPPQASNDAGDESHADAGSDAAPAIADILGTLTGSCNVVPLLATAAPSFEENDLTFVAGESYDRPSLSPDAQRMFDTPNAGGTSTESEIMSFEVLRACDGAKLLKTETEIGYIDDDAGAQTITDILVEIAGQKVGVSVTRAYKPSNMTFSDADVKALLEKKLEGVLRSSARVAPQDRWVKQILHVFAATNAQADAVSRMLPTIDATIRGDTIVLLTKTKGGGFVYCNPDPPLGSECP
jgi:hypothetical protein